MKSLCNLLGCVKTRTALSRTGWWRGLIALDDAVHVCERPAG